MKEFLRLLSKISMKTVLLFFWIFPIKKNKIVFLNGCNFMYSDSPKSLCEYILGNYKNDIDVYFVVKKGCNVKRENVKFIFSDTFEYFYHVCTTKVFITNDGGISYIPFRKSQVVINTWHGGGAYKAIGRTLNRNVFFQFDLKMSSANTDVFLSSCKKFTDSISDALLIPKSKFWEIGLPRNDCLINRDIQYIKSVKTKIGLSEHEKLVLYAPTFRRADASMGQNESVKIEIDSDIERILSVLCEKWDGKWFFGFRNHPGIKNKKTITKPNVVDLSNYPDMQELLLVADVLITDYSSSIWDFMLTQKPIFIYAPDIIEYSQKCKFYTPINEWPFPISTDAEALKQSIKLFDYNDYLMRCKAHYDALGGNETGNATKFLAEYIIDNISG